MYRYFQGTTRDSIPGGLPARLVDPMLRTFADKPQFLRIGEGDDPRNELMRVVKQYPSQDEVRTKVVKDALSLDYADKYNLLRDTNRRYALIKASQQTGIPLESMGLSVDPESSAFRIQGAFNPTTENVSNARTLLGRIASDDKARGDLFLYNALAQKQKRFSLPRGYRELAVDGTEGVEAIMAAYEKAEPRRTALSQGNRPILMQADGLDPNIGIPTGSPENIPPMDIEGMKGANRYVDVSQGLETARTIQYPNIYDRLNNGAQPLVTATIPYSADIPTTIGDSILSPKVSIETKRPRFIDEGTGIYTRQGEPINAEQQNLLDTGMADLEDRSFILRDPADVNRQYTTQRQYWLGRTRDVSVPINEQYRPTTRIGMEVIGLNADRAIDPVVIPSKDSWGTTVIPEKRIGLRAATPISRLTDDLSDRVLSGDVDLRNYEPFKSINTPQYYLDQSKEFVGPIRITKNNTYGATQGRTPWREYYSDPFVYEDKGLDSEVNRLMRAVNEAPAQLENAYTQQASANRRAIDASERLKFLGQNQSVRMGLLPQGEGVVNLAREVRKDRRIAEIDVAKANDTIAQLKAAQELLGVEYMGKPQQFSPEVLEGYRIGSNTIGGIRDSSEVAINSRFTDSFDDSVKIYKVDPQPTMPIAMQREAINIKPNAVEATRFALQQEAMENNRDYDIASLFGFTGNY